MIRPLHVSALALATALGGPALAQAAAPTVILPTDQDVLKPTAEGQTAPPVARPRAGAAAPQRAAAPAAQPAPARVDLTAALIRQGKGWRARGRKDLANESLRRAVQASPGNAEAIFLLAQYAAQDGNAENANAWLNRLRGLVGPGDGRVASVERLLNRGASPPPTVARANDGLFPQRPAPVAATPVAATPPPQRPAPRVAEAAARPAPAAPRAAPVVVRPAPQPAEVMLPRAQVQKLAEMAPPPPPPEAAPAAPATPGEPPAAAPRKADPDPGGEARASGFRALNAGQIREAETQFERALAARVTDSDARGGLGIVRVRQQRFGEAEQLLVQAMRGPEPQRWQEALDTARFFGGLIRARNSAEAGRLADSETQVRSLMRGGYRDKTEAEILLASVLLRQQRFGESESLYRGLYGRVNDRPEIVLGLAESLARLGREDEAIAFLDKAPRTRDTQQVRAQLERTRATALMSKGDNFGAGAALAAALNADPENPWTRYEFAKFLINANQPREASEVAAPLFAQANSDSEALQAAALYADFAGDPQRAQALLQRIPPAERNAQVREFAERVDVKSQLTRAQLLQRQGQTVQAVSLLRQIVAKPGLPFGARAQIAQSLFDMGDNYQAGSLALQAARDPLPQSATPGDGTGFLLVLGGAGQDDAANMLLQKLAERVRTPEDQAAWRQAYGAYAEKRADALRLGGDLAGAFDILSAAVAVLPRHAGLMSTLARVYATGNMQREAGQAYDAALSMRPNDPSLALDAARSAAAGEDYGRAVRLIERALRQRPDDPETYYELGKIEQARGRERAAVQAFERADRLLARSAGGPAGLRNPQGVLGPNPFARIAGAAAPAVPAPQGSYASFGPAPANAPAAAPNPALPAWAGGRASAPAAYGQATAPAVPPSFAAYALPANGQAAMVPAMASPSAVPQPPVPQPAMPVAAMPQAYAQAQAPFPQPRVPEIGYQPQSAYPAAEPYAGRGYGPVQRTAEARPPRDRSAPVYEAEPNVDVPVLGGRITAVTDASAPLAVRVRSELTAAQLDSIPLVEGQVNMRARSGESGTSNLTEIGATIEALAPLRGVGQLGVRVRPVLISAGTPNLSATGRTGTYPLITAPGIINGVDIVLPAQRTRNDAGVEASLLFRSGWLSADVGMSPYGFLYNDIIGGVRATPRFGALELRVGAERRAVEDSVLSWAGTLDPVTGIASGGVRRNAANIGVSVTGGSVGGYLDGSFRRFTGRNVPDNDSIEVNGGFYWRLINETDRRLQIGMNVNYQSFERNLRYFTLGHGGYFSPQQFVAIGLPINYLGAGDDWRFSLNVTPGVQSFSEDPAPYFPGFATQQNQLVSLSLLDDAVPAFYLGTSRSGFGIASRVSGEYRIQRATSLGGLLSLDTFGAFSEFRAGIFLRRQFNIGK